MKDWQEKVKVGDMLNTPAWNATVRGNSAFPSPVAVIDVIPARSQSGVLFAVRANSGIVQNLDADWFEAPTTND